MKPIKLAQCGSTIAILVVVAFLLVVGGVLLFTLPERIEKLVSMAGILALFIAPEKVVAFFGPIIKRRQQQGQGEKGEEG